METIMFFISLAFVGLNSGIAYDAARLKKPVWFGCFVAFTGGWLVVANSYFLALAE